MIRDNLTDGQRKQRADGDAYVYGLTYARTAGPRGDRTIAEPARLWFRSPEDRAGFIRTFTEAGYDRFIEEGPGSGKVTTA